MGKSSKFSTYKRTESIKARKVTSKGGEQIVTSTGPQHVSQGDYVVQDENGDRVVSGEAFESQGWSKPAKRAAAKKSAAKPDTPAADKPSTDKPLTPAQRIAQAKARSGS